MTRSETISRAFLRYLYEDTRFRPEVAAFLDSPHALAHHPPVTEAELVAVLDELRSSELIATSGGFHAEGIPVRAGLTGSGLICAGHYGGDVAAWARASGGTVTTVASRPDPGPAVVSPRRSPEPMHGGKGSFTGIIRVCRVLLLALPSVQATRAEDESAGQAASRLLEAARAPDPDPRRVRLLAQNLRLELTTGPVANTLGVVLLDGLDEAIREARLR